MRGVYLLEVCSSVRVTWVLVWVVDAGKSSVRCYNLLLCCGLGDLQSIVQIEFILMVRHCDRLRWVAAGVFQWMLSFLVSNPVA